MFCLACLAAAHFEGRIVVEFGVDALFKFGQRHLQQLHQQYLLMGETLYELLFLLLNLYLSLCHSDLNYVCKSNKKLIDTILLPRLFHPCASLWQNTETNGPSVRSVRLSAGGRGICPCGMGGGFLSPCEISR